MFTFALFLSLLGINAAWNPNLVDPKPLRPVRLDRIPPNHLIVNGQDASPNEFPFTVNLDIDGLYFCGGSIINMGAVLTAAHCADGARTIDVIAGDHNRLTTEPTEQVQTSSGANIIMHPTYDPFNIVDDVAVLRLNTPFRATAAVAGVTLAAKGMEENYVGQTARAIGWGRTSTGGSLATVLQKTTVNVVDDTVCRDAYGNGVTDSQLCTSTRDRTGVCNGDSGGPLMCGGVQCGVVSYGASAGCAIGYPDGFSEVTYFRDWIDANSS